MKSFNYLLFLLFISFILLISTSAFGCKLTVRFEQYPPQAYLDKEHQWHGMDVEMAKALLNEAGCEYRFVRIPWARSLEMMQRGEVDMMLSVSKNPLRQKFIHFIGPQRQENIVLISLASSPITIEKFNNLNTFGKPIAIQKGAYYGEKLARMLEEDDKDNSHFIVIPNNEAKLSLLHRGRVSGVIEEKLNILHQIKNTPQLTNTAVYPVVVHVNPVYFALSRASTSPLLLVKLNKAFATLQQNDILTRIAQKYDAR